MRNSDLAGERQGQQWCPAAGGIEWAVGLAAPLEEIELLEVNRDITAPLHPDGAARRGRTDPERVGGGQCHSS
jgi:hypothetical protein